MVDGVLIEPVYCIYVLTLRTYVEYEQCMRRYCRYVLTVRYVPTRTVLVVFEFAIHAAELTAARNPKSAI